MKRYKPLFEINEKIIELQRLIGIEAGEIKTMKVGYIPFKLRKTNMVKAIQANLAIGKNSLTLDQVIDTINGKPVIGPKKDIKELKQALKMYEQIDKFNPLNIDDLLKAHKILMAGLIPQFGRFRSTYCGIFQGNKLIKEVAHEKRVPELMSQLFEYINHGEESWLLKSCIFHYEFECIHPFQDGNGRMGRFWQQLILMKHHKLFRDIPIEVIVKEYEFQYYEAMHISNLRGNSTLFIEFLLQKILKSLRKIRQELK